MSVVVAKFGGTSVANPERIRSVAQRIVSRKRAGDSVVAVVSAMGKTTDDLVALASSISDSPDPREMDTLLSTGEMVSMSLLAMAVAELGEEAISLSGRQIGLITDSVRTSPASTRQIRASFRVPARLTRLATRKCSRWPRVVWACCTSAASSSRVTLAW